MPDNTYRSIHIATAAAGIGWIVAILGIRNFIQVGIEAEASHTNPTISPFEVFAMLGGFLIVNIAVGYIFRISARLISAGKDKKHALNMTAWGALLSLTAFITYVATPISLGLVFIGLKYAQDVEDKELKKAIWILAGATCVALAVAIVSALSLR